MSPPDGACHGFTPYEFVTRDPPPCEGPRFVRYDEHYAKWVGVALCDSETYKLYLAEDREGEFRQIGDGSGHGQDHCELVNPDFRIPDEGDITSGGCTACATSADFSWYSNPVGTAGYYRASFGEPFEAIDPWPEFNIYTVSWLACGVSFPEDGVCEATEVIPTPPDYEWAAFEFDDAGASTPCDGERYVRFDEGYDLWVGAALCSANRYKIYLSESRDGLYLAVGDYAGHGQDHCELVSSSFTIPDEDDITSGGCIGCNLSGDFWDTYVVGDPVYSRAQFGDAFLRETWPEYTLYSAPWYECGVSIP